MSIFMIIITWYQYQVIAPPLISFIILITVSSISFSSIGNVFDAKVSFNKENNDLHPSILEFIMIYDYLYNYQ